MGAPLARLEGRIVFETLLERSPETELLDDRPRSRRKPQASARFIIIDTNPSVLLADPVIDSRMNTLVFHLKVWSLWIAPASVLTFRTLDAIKHFQLHNLFRLIYDFPQPELSRACRLGPRGSVCSPPRAARSDANQVTSGLEYLGS